MHNPPPMADQFVRDLRKMMTLARHRINQRRHVPQLGSIPEEPPDQYEPYMRRQEA